MILTWIVWTAMDQLGIAQANILIQDRAHKSIVSMIESDTPMFKLSEEPLSNLCNGLGLSPLDPDLMGVVINSHEKLP
jgi:hypothetical protein